MINIERDGGMKVRKEGREELMEMEDMTEKREGEEKGEEKEE